MMAGLQSLAARFDALSSRERVIVAAAGVLAVTGGWYLLWGEAALNAHARYADERDSLQHQLSGLSLQLGEQRDARQVTAADARQRFEQLRQRSAAAQTEIDAFAAELISPTEMAHLLERVLDRRRALRLKRLANLGAEDLLSEDVPGEQRLYRHRFEMELEGPYLDFLAFLEDLESLPWRLYWQAIEIESDEYPSNRIRIEVATLSLDEEWIGV